MDFNRIKERLRSVNPIFWFLLFFMIFQNIRNTGSFSTWMYNKIITLPGIIIGVTFHEAAHAFASNRLGDPTPKQMGRLSLNPKYHIDPFGFLCLIIAGFGWGRPVEINPLYYKKRRRDEIIVASAGVITNFLIAFFVSLIVKFLYANMSQTFYNGLGEIIIDILVSVVAINIILMLFNLIPVPPLDGFNIVTQAFSLQKYDWWYKVYRSGSLILMVMICFNITSSIITPLYLKIMSLLL